MGRDAGRYEAVTADLEELSRGVAAAREAGQAAPLARALLDWAEAQPLFSRTAERVLEALDDAVAFGGGQAAGASAAPPDELLAAARRQLRRAQALVVVSRHVDAAQAARMGSVLAIESGDETLAWRGRAVLAAVLARTATSPLEALDLARAVAGRGSRLADRAEGRALRAAARTAEADCALNNQMLAQAAEAYEEVLQLYKPLPERFDDERCHALMALVTVHQQQQNQVRALTRLNSAAAIAGRYDAPVELFHIQLTTANLLTGFNRYDEAVPLLQAAAMLADATPQVAPLRTSTRVLLAVNYMALGQLDKALEAAQWAYDTTLGAGDVLGHVQSSGVLSGVHRARGDHPEAYRVLSYAAARLELSGNAEAAHLVRRMVGELRDFMGAEAFEAMAQRMADDELAKRRLRGS